MKSIKYQGAELSEKRNRYGTFTPPKIASVASSSRFCYLALKDGDTLFWKKGEEMSCQDVWPLWGGRRTIDLDYQGCEDNPLSKVSQNPWCSGH